MEGKEYVVKDGDVILFRFNVSLSLFCLSKQFLFCILKAENRINKVIQKNINNILLKSRKNRVFTLVEKFG